MSYEEFKHLYITKQYQMIPWRWEAMKRGVQISKEQAEELQDIMNWKMEKVIMGEWLSELNSQNIKLMLQYVMQATTATEKANINRDNNELNEDLNVVLGYDEPEEIGYEVEEDIIEDQDLLF